MHESTTRQLHERNLPRERHIAQSNFIALYWEKPIADLYVHGEILPGLNETALLGLHNHQNSQKTLGEFLTDGQIKYFKNFQDELREISPLARSALQKLRVLCPNFSEILHRHPDQVNWLPWEAIIAYGDILLAQKTPDQVERIRERINSVMIGAPYIQELREAFPKGHYPRKRVDIAIGRQNADARTQGTIEGIANAVDAISARAKIGQFGLGVKQLFSLLEIGEGEMRVFTKTADGQENQAHARRGYNDQIFLKFGGAERSREQFDEKFTEQKHGTLIELTDLHLTPEFLAELKTEVRQHFVLVPEAEIYLNGELLNHHERVTSALHQGHQQPQGQIWIEVTPEKISLRDTGSGMDSEALFKMFLIRKGKGYSQLSKREAEEIARRDADVYFMNESTPRIVFSRNREAVYSLPIPQDRLNTSPSSIFLEMGRILKVSEQKAGFELDENFVLALPILVERALSSTTLDDQQKISFLNSLILGIESLPAQVGESEEDAMTSLMKKARNAVCEAAAPYLRKLETPLLPNYTGYGRIQQEGALFVDPFLLQKRERNVGLLLEKQGYQKLSTINGVESRGNTQLFLADLSVHTDEMDLFQATQKPELLLRLRENFADRFPVMIDVKNHIVILDNTVWQRVVEEQDPVKKKYLEELIEELINQYVFTSYERNDQRTLFIREAKKVVGEALEERKENGREVALPRLTERELLDFEGWYPGSLVRNVIAHGNVYSFSESGNLVIRNLQDPRDYRMVFMAEIFGNGVQAIRSTADGLYLRTFFNRFIHIDKNGKILNSQRTTDDHFIVSRDEVIAGDGTIYRHLGGSAIQKIDAQGVVQNISLMTGNDIGDKANIFFARQNGDLIIADRNMFYIYDSKDGVWRGEGSKTTLDHTQLFEDNGRVYVISFEKEQKNQDDIKKFYNLIMAIPDESIDDSDTVDVTIQSRHFASRIHADSYRADVRVYLTEAFHTINGYYPDSEKQREKFEKFVKDFEEILEKKSSLAGKPLKLSQMQMLLIDYVFAKQAPEKKFMNYYPQKPGTEIKLSDMYVRDKGEDERLDFSFDPTTKKIMFVGKSRDVSAGTFMKVFDLNDGLKTAKAKREYFYGNDEGPGNFSEISFAAARVLGAVKGLFDEDDSIEHGDMSISLCEQLAQFAFTSDWELEPSEHDPLTAAQSIVLKKLHSPELQEIFHNV